MKNGDFIDLVTRYGSYFVEEKQKHHEVITEFINYVANQQGIDYGIHMEELEKHKKKDVVPVDVDVMILLSRQLEDCYSVLWSIYQNLGKDFPQVEAYVEHLANKHHGTLWQNLKQFKD